MTRQSLKTRKALRSAIAKKGWETRRRNRQLAEFDRHATVDTRIDGALMLTPSAGALAAAARLTPIAEAAFPSPAPDVNPWPRMIAAVKRVVGGFVGRFR